MKKLISAVLSLLFVYMLCACNAPQRQQLSAPKNLRVENEMLEWDAVEHAEGYVVYFSDAEHETEEPRCDLSVLAPGEHEIDVLAVGSGQYLNSNWSTISYRKEAPVAHDYDEAGFEYTLLEDDSGYEIALGRADCLEVLEIPETFRGLPVKKVADEGFAPPFGKYNYATKVLKLPSCLEVIGTAAFWYFGSLEEVSIPDSVQEIGRYAFAEDYRLKRVSLPKGLKVIPDCCFESCAVEQIVFPENLIEIGQGAFSPSVNTGEYEQGNRDSAPDLFELEIPDSVKTIGIGAFSACYKLREIKFPKSLETLGMHAFDRTEWYDRQPDGFITIGDILYEYKGELEQDATVVIPSNIKRIAGGAFYGSHYSMNKKLAEVVIPDGVTFIGTAVFSGCRNLRRVRLPADLTDIPDETFACCESLTEIALPDGVVSVGETAFKYCISLNKLTLSANLRSIGQDCFRDCHALEDLHIPSGLQVLGQYAFSKCGAKEIILPVTLQEIGLGPFKDCSALERVYYEGTAAQLDALLDVNNAHVELSDGSFTRFSPFSDATVYYYSKTAPAVKGPYWHYDAARTPQLW